MIERFLDGLAAKMAEPLDTQYMMIVLPEDIEPMERHLRYSVSLDAELRLAGLGCSEGGATMLSEEDEDGARDVLFTVIDVDVTDVDRARTAAAALARAGMPKGDAGPVRPARRSLGRRALDAGTTAERDRGIAGRFADIQGQTT